ncbi:response regulator transcription factor [Alteriqipengyuania lutimaris]|uniref:DNA-binding response regulator n=1 Tax=Alteriqipengyuania lutimaris TaxID=1538146 RepID=A0A395LSC9_9SPHN|nr:response regulator [Alteriqipengyuania lutimaris]MBB3032512.1 two-component system response regulator FixJ [Alteriqipengyuania lutimaris]RDS78354.1 DNA-binding response regulator [Alteriqipengyuania lutimaris]
MRSIYIVDDDQAIRSELYSLLSVYPNTLLRSFASGDEFIAQLDELDPALILLDMKMPGASGLDVLAAMGDRKDLLPIVLTGQGDTRIAVQAMKAGATDFLEKPCDPKTLLQTIDLAFETLEETEAVIARTAQAREKLARLSARERDVLDGLIEGKSNKIIGYELDISPRTVEVYRGKMMEKLEVQSLSEALRVAFSAGLVEG